MTKFPLRRKKSQVKSMAALAGEMKEEKQGMLKAIQDRSSSSGGSEFRLNPNAPEFVPNSFIHMTISDYFAQYLEFVNSGGERMGSDCIKFEDEKTMHPVPDSNVEALNLDKNAAGLSQKIVKQVEYQFSDANLIASDFLVKIMSKDPEGYVPMHVIASSNKIKNLGASNQMLINALRTSSELVVSEDGKKVRRKKPFTEKDKEELMSRTILVENLLEADSSHQNIKKIFSRVGSVKNIRICHAQAPNLAWPLKTDNVIISNKLHAFVEFERTDQADKAVEKLNDESNWRIGLRVRSLAKRAPKSVIKNIKRSDCDHLDSEQDHLDQSPLSQDLESQKTEQKLQKNVDEKQNGAKKGWGRGRGKQTGPVKNSINGCEALSRKARGGPRMPDGTRGFTMGRGKPFKGAIDELN